MLIDTDASGRLVFGRNHTARLGFDPAALVCGESYSSANGVGQEASVRVREFRLGSFVLRDVPAAITAAPQDVPLLNVEILHHLDLRLSGGNCELRLP
jgi:predicted aspartyl protease